MKRIKELENIVLSLVEIKNTIIRHPKLFIIISGLIASYFLFNYITYIQPKSPIQEFFNSINEREYDAAWYRLTEKYREDIFRNDRDLFRRVYYTTSHFSNIEIKHTKSIKNLINDLFSKDRVYNVVYEAEDRINKKDLSDSGLQALNSFWVEVQEEIPISRLKNSTQRLFILRRIFHQEIRVIKEHGKWKIAQRKTTEIGLKK